MTDSIFNRHTSTIPYLNTPEMLSLSKTSIPYHSPKGVSDYDAFDDNVMYGGLRPDHVFKLIENHKWNNAISQLNRNRRIAQQWVVNAGTRRLPIHEACVRKPTTEMVYTLLNIYPDGAKAKDSNGRHPIHHACVHGASADTICQLLHIFPESANVNDNWGKTPKVYALNTATPDVDVIQALFHKSQYDIETVVSRINKVCAAGPSLYEDYCDTQKSSQLVPYEEMTPRVKTPVESRSTFHMVALENALQQTNVHPYSAYTHADNTGQELEANGRRIDYLNSACLDKKTASRRADQALAEATGQRDTAFSRMDQLQRDRRRSVQAMSAVESQRHNSYGEVARLQQKANELNSRAEEAKHLTLELSRVKEHNDLVCLARDKALRKVAQLENKICELETQVQGSKRTKEIIMKKDVENDMLRNINKDLRGTIVSLSSKLNTVMKDLDSAKGNISASDELVSEVRRLQEFRRIAENKIEELEGQESGQAKIIDKLNDELEELNASYFDVTSALVVKSKDYFMLKSELDQRNKVDTRYHYS